jgi:hypothetical protein
MCKEARSRPNLPSIRGYFSSLTVISVFISVVRDVLDFEVSLSVHVALDNMNIAVRARARARVCVCGKERYGVPLNI